MVEQILGGVKHQAGAEPAIIRDPWVKLHDMFHPHPITFEIPVTLLALNFVLTVLFYLTYRRVPLVGKRIQFGGADHFHHYWPSQGSTTLVTLMSGCSLCLDYAAHARRTCSPGLPGQPVGWSFTQVFHQQGF